tara:strand:+ start:1192 stop:1359 length:168 start_codon:yes stop_codon:yes gene_type:complete
MSILYVLELSKKIVVSVIEKSWARAIDKENIFNTKTVMNLVALTIRVLCIANDKK